MRSYRIIFHDDLIRKRIKVTVRLFSKNSEHDIQPLEILLPPVFGFFDLWDLCGTFVGAHLALLMATFVVILMPAFVRSHINNAHIRSHIKAYIRKI